MEIVGLIIGLVALFVGGDWLVAGASRLARSLGISAVIVGLTVVAIGTSAPELLVSLSAALRGSADITVGNVVGSNIANIGLILGISGLIYPVTIGVTLLRREIPIMIIVVGIGYLLMRDGVVSQLDGLLLVAGLLAFLAFMIQSARAEMHDEDEEEVETVNRPREAARLLIGVVVLVAGAQLTVDNATTIALSLGISELVIGVTLVAIGTSLPELVTSVTAAVRRENDIALGNVVGSNIFNVLAILGITATISPVDVAETVILIDGFVMVAFAVALFPFALNRTLGRIEAAAYIVAYLVFVGYVVITALT
jgi:cation:H+ antiporter